MNTTTTSYRSTSSEDLLSSCVRYQSQPNRLVIGDHDLFALDVLLKVPVDADVSLDPQQKRSGQLV